MTVNEWVESFWAVLNVRPKTLHDYKRLSTPTTRATCTRRAIFFFNQSLNLTKH